MSALQQIKTMFDYNYALYDQVWASVPAFRGRPTKLE